MFKSISTKVKTISDFLIPGTQQLLKKAEFEKMHAIEITDENLTELHYIIKLSCKRLGIKDPIAPFLPSQPLLIGLLNLTKKGCSAYYKILKKRSNLGRTLTASENKWHMELGCTFGPVFWNKSYSLNASIKNDNKLKWLQFQINRNSLFTNYRVSRFKNNVSPLCSFCSHLDGAAHSELVSHLFFECDFALNLWQEVRGWLATFQISLELNRNKLLFGVHDLSSNSVQNVIILCVKYYIWKSKFQSKDLNLSGFQSFLTVKLDDLKNACLYEEKENKFEKWLIIFEFLERLP